MRRNNILFYIFIIPLVIVLAIFLYRFTYHTINESFFKATVEHTVETLQVIRDLGIEKVDHKLSDLKVDLENEASQRFGQLTDGTSEERAAVLSRLPLPQDGIDYWYCTSQGESVSSNGRNFDWKTVFPDLDSAFFSENAVVLDPYFDEKENYILPIGAPLRENGQVTGVLVVRLDGYCLSRWLENLQFETGGGLGYIITGDGRNIATSRELNYDWITSQYNAQKLVNKDAESKSVADLERLPLEGKSGWGTYEWEGETNYLVYAPMEETDWGFFVGFYGEMLGENIQRVASKSTASSQPLILILLILLAILAVYATLNLRKEKGYARELLRQKQEIQKQAQELAVSDERFRVALEQTRNIIFEYNIETETIVHFYTAEEADHHEVSFESLQERLVLGGEIDDESVERLKQSLKEIGEGSPQNECMIKVLRPDETDAWYKVSISSIFDQNRHPIRAIGILEDITKERYAELDPLTGILNKEVLKKQISSQLSRMNETEVCAFLMLDIDEFKMVNDIYGHPEGDRVIIEIAEILKRVFSRNALVGRVGGDEFCVFCYGSPSLGELKQMLESIRGQMRAKLGREDEADSVTFSCGIAFCSVRNKKFETLYQEADNALYQAKKDGKNQSVFTMENA